MVQGSGLITEIKQNLCGHRSKGFIVLVSLRIRSVTFREREKSINLAGCGDLHS